MGAFPRVGLKEPFLDVRCGLCALESGSTYDSFVGEYSVEFGLDGKGAEGGFCQTTTSS